MPSLSFTPPLADGGLPSLRAQRPWARNVSHWKPLPVRTVIATRLSSVYQSPCLSTDSDSIAQTFFVFSSCSDTIMLNLSCYGMAAYALSRCQYLHCRIRGLYAVCAQGQVLCRPIT